MRNVKYCCGVLAAVYLVLALLPTDVIAPHNTTNDLWPAWFGRAISFTDFSLLAIAFYGMRSRRPIYWTLIPIVLIIYISSVLIPALWTLIALSLPWRPFIIIVALFIIGVLVFYAWWRKQQSYFM